MRERGPDRYLWVLLGLALLTRVIWVAFVHPPGQAVFSDMGHYLARAERLAASGPVVGERAWAWQAWGTHTLLAIPLALFGRFGLEAAALLWAACSAATVVFGHLVARRLLPLPVARVIGVALLVWIPSLSHTGFFISETPYACALVLATLAMLRLIQDGERPLAAGCWAALAFVLRPQAGLWFALLGVLWLWSRRGPAPAGFERVSARHALWFALPLVVALGFSLIRFTLHTGYFGGVAESANMNLSAGRCHNIVTQAFDDETELAESEASGSTMDGRRISLPNFRALEHLDPDHPLALRPALGGESIKLVGPIGDRATHRAIRARCYAATGVLEQARYAAVNTLLLWILARPWPESSDQAHPGWLPWAKRGRDLAALLAPLTLLGLFMALMGWRRDPGLALVALQYASLLIVSALVFGSPRLRTPHDPAALVLVASALVRLATRVRAQ